MQFGGGRAQHEGCGGLGETPPKALRINTEWQRMLFSFSSGKRRESPVWGLRPLHHESCPAIRRPSRPSRPASGMTGSQNAHKSNRFLPVGKQSTGEPHLVDTKGIKGVPCLTTGYVSVSCDTNLGET